MTSSPHITFLVIRAPYGLQMKIPCGARLPPCGISRYSPKSNIAVKRLIWSHLLFSMGDNSKNSFFFHRVLISWKLKINDFHGHGGIHNRAQIWLTTMPSCWWSITPIFFIRSSTHFEKASIWSKIFSTVLKSLFCFLNFDIFPIKKRNLKRLCRQNPKKALFSS